LSHVDIEVFVKPTDRTKQFVIAKYVEPARTKGEATIQVKVGNVQKELGWTNRTPSVFSTLSSKDFQEEAGVELLEKRGGPPSGGPSTTVQFIYRVLASTEKASPGKVVPNGAGLMELYGILADAYKSVGGGEAYLKAERAAWGPDPWEKLAIEKDEENRG
jgi:hypothetical protein